MNKKIIGIPGWKVGDNSYGVTSTYLEYISHFGNPRIIMPWEEKVDCDLLFLPGGKDLSPSSYGEIPGFNTGDSDVFKEHFFKERLKNYIGNTPIFGVCLGFQQLAVYFGCKLKQDLIYHDQSQHRWEEAHDVVDRIIKDGNGDWIVPEKVGSRFKVNSHHHQGLLLSQVNTEEISPLLYAKYYPTVDETEGYVLVEAFRHKKHKIFACQWHPEEHYTEYCTETMKFLLEI